MANKQRHSGVSLFCESTSIRGMAKIARSQTRFLKTLWLLFIVFMTGGLFASATLLVLDFLNYDVGVHTSNADIRSEFPALTICHHHPFSSDAYKLWEQKRVMSPTMFNKNLRQLGKNALLNNKGIFAARSSLFYDSVDVYYQNLKLEETLQLGHNWTIYRNCMTLQDQTMSYEDDCQKLDLFVVKRLSHFKYFNCFTFEPINKTVAESTQVFSVVVKMGPAPNYSHYEQAFLMDIFEQAKGLRVVVHERGSYPDMETEGIQVEPGKFTEITYEPIKHEKLDTPVKPCADSNRTFTDLGRSYTYAATQCDHYHDQLLFNKQCRCIYALYLRPNFPDEDLKYCGSIESLSDSHALADRGNCLAMIMSSKEPRSKGPDKDGVSCVPRCKFFEFRNQISITKWRVTQWQLYWLRYQHRLMESLLHKENSFRQMNKTLNLSETDEYISLSKYLNSKNLTKISQQSSGEDFLDGDENFAYVRLKRKNAITIVMKEKLILSLNVLMSRVGGLCSLSIGLNTAFVVELIEFIYLYCRAQAQRHNEATSGPKSRGIKDANDREDALEFSIFESPRAHASELYTSRNGRALATRPRLLRTEYNLPMNASKVKYNKESSASAFLS